MIRSFTAGLITQPQSYTWEYTKERKMMGMYVHQNI